LWHFLIQLKNAIKIHLTVIKDDGDDVGYVAEINKFIWIDEKSLLTVCLQYNMAKNYIQYILINTRKTEGVNLTSF